jgi:signal transduction histidine kinase
MDARILLVDDSHDIIAILTDILSRQGYQIESFSDGESCWKRLVAGAENTSPMPDLLLLDLMMPGLDGMTLLKRIRADNRLALLLVAILTAQTDPEAWLAALQAGANDYLSKPIQPIELLARVKALLGRKLAERLQQHRMEHLVEAGRLLLSTLDLGDVLQRVMQIAMSGMDAEGVSVWLPGPSEELECQAAFGAAAERLVGTRLGQGIAGWALRHKEPVLVSDARTDPRLAQQAGEHAALHIRDLVAVPLLVRGSGIGVLEAINKKQETFSPIDLAWLEVLAPLAAAAIANARLFQELHQRTIQLQARNEELDAFAHTAAHDLKSPLASIVGFAETLEENYIDLPDEELRRYLHTMSQHGRKMSRIVDELLLLAGVRKMEAAIGPLDMASILAEALQRLSSMIEESQAHIALPDAWPAALGYGPWIEEVWINYLSNAIKYGGRPLQIQVGATRQADGMVCFWVRDNGAGLTSQAQARLFTPFTRLDQVRAEGHGLGLSIVRRIVEKLGGQVGVRSEVGRGSIFTFTLNQTRYNTR